VVGKEGLPKDRIVTVAGRCCESGDILIENLPVPDDIKPGDLLAVFNTGAYNYSMASNYNMLPRPAVVFVENGKDFLAVERETYDDLLAKQRSICDD
jgi:diaminopimelate decarboxylase